VQHASGTISQPEIQLFPVYTNRTDFMKACPPLGQARGTEHRALAVVERSAQHSARRARADSVRRRVHRGRRADHRRVEMVQSSNVNAKLEYVEHTGAAIDAGDKDLTKLEMQMQAMGLQLLIDDTKGQSATGEIRDDAKENSPLAMMATRCRTR
jgi:hypothetical protein